MQNGRSSLFLFELSTMSTFKRYTFIPFEGLIIRSMNIPDRQCQSKNDYIVVFYFNLPSSLDEFRGKIKNPHLAYYNCRL